MMKATFLSIRRAGLLAGLGASLGILFAPCTGKCGDVDADARTKALDLLNFAQYVDWPPEAFGATNQAITIGLTGKGGFADMLRNTAAGKTINGRNIAILEATNRNDWRKCQILFIGQADQKRLPEILNRTWNRPILTVSETPVTARTAVIVNFTRPDDRIRFDIDLAAARQAKLQIHAKLLSLADQVKGKP
jgi:hypothetical protein